MMSDCEELSGGYSGDDGVYSLYVTPLRLFDVPEVLLVHDVPSGEVRMVPESPTVTNILIFSTTFVSF